MAAKSQRNEYILNKILRIEFYFWSSRKPVMIMYEMFVDIYSISWWHYKITKLMKIIKDISTEGKALTSTLTVRRDFKEAVPEKMIYHKL